MKKNTNIDRRTSLKIGSLAALGLVIPNMSFANQSTNRILKLTKNDIVPKHFPNISPEVIEDVVGKSHFDLDRVKELVDKRPELSRSVWEWRFGDFESAIGAASHVGRRDIALYLMSKGARPTIFTFAMLGHFQVVKSIIEASNGIQKVTGPHGISLLDHAYAGRRMKDKMTETEIENLERTIDYLTALGNASGEKYIDVTKEEQEKYLGDYKYGNGEKEGFTINVNMRKLLSLGPIGGFGGALYKIEENKFIYNGAPSVIITFDIQDDLVKSLTIYDPDVTIIAKKVS
ncbi:hypothetical protein [Tenacibaculum caenipelagi]|uniref:Ankyrin repeat protein n=1 Tax=Tenacibaculum caenipelagi TaxID=1325435 RepID=A0A4R6TC74_9FLAO|nr:hypothetical protein [Tenacibaculum caenipelagi]TDQ25751.1 hypothetical protein DFQ07_2182 [Tenacibaculum caenipelagi]